MKTRPITRWPWLLSLASPPASTCHTACTRRADGERPGGQFFHRTPPAPIGSLLGGTHEDRILQTRGAWKSSLDDYRPRLGPFSRCCEPRPGASPARSARRLPVRSTERRTESWCRRPGTGSFSSSSGAIPISPITRRDRQSNPTIVPPGSAVRDSLLARGYAALWQRPQDQRLFGSRADSTTS